MTITMIYKGIVPVPVLQGRLTTSPLVALGQDISYASRGSHWIFSTFPSASLGARVLWSPEDDWTVSIFKDILVVLSRREEADFKVVFTIFDGLEVVNLPVEELLVGSVVCVRGFSSLDLSDPVVISGKLSSPGCTDTVSRCLYPTVNVLFRLKKVVVFTVCPGFLVVGVSMSMVVSGSSVVVATVVVEGGGKVADKINQIF